MFRFLIFDSLQFAIQLAYFGFLDHRLFQELGGGGQGYAHFINRHVFDQLERQHTDQRQPYHQHETLLPAVPRRCPDRQGQLEQFAREDRGPDWTDAEEGHRHPQRQANRLLVLPTGRQNHEFRHRGHGQQGQC